MTKSITLQSLVLLNFKGIRELKLQLNNANADISGDNATGKTTINDGVTWLLFDKDSLNRKDFQFKTVDSQNNEIHNLEHSVEGIFSVDGAELSLKKIFKEKWTKKRGAATAEFTGHTTDYFINGVPSKKGEYTNKVAELVNEDTFKLLTTPTFFNEHMKWQDRRSVLMEIAGDLSDAEVIVSSDKLKALETILNSHSIADHRKMIASKKTAINKELNAIPVRIDEVRKSMADMSDFDLEANETAIENSRHMMKEREDKIAEIRNGSAVLQEKNNEVVLKGELEKLKFEYSEKHYAALNRKRDEIRKLSDKENDYTTDYKKAKRKHEELVSECEKEEEYAEKLRRLWEEENPKTFDLHAVACSQCGQELPEDKKQEMIEKFNVQKSEKIAEIVTLGKRAAGKVEQFNTEIAAASNEILSIEAELKEIKRQKQEASQQFEDMKAETTRFEDTPEYSDIQNKIAASLLKQGEIQNGDAQAQEKLRQEIKEIGEGLEQALEAKAEYTHSRKSEERVKELEAQQQQLAEEYEKIEHQLFLTEEFIRTKVNLLEEKINNKFKMAKFKLFNTQINGAVEECCETLFEGVPYSKGLNNAARINVGLDIINTLSDHYGVRAPIFIDNAEAVTKLIEVDSQVIALRVDGNYKKLNVEVQG